MKPLNNLQGRKVVVTEHVVGLAGRLIGAPVCEVAVVRIPEEVAGWEFRPGAKLEPGLACGSLAVESASEVRTLQDRGRDDNARRHAGVYALYDWCWGGDDQWLHCETDDRKLYSHDHGWYLPETGPDWDEATLIARVDEQHVARYPTDGLRNVDLYEFRNQLERSLRGDLAAMLATVPSSWPVTDKELEVLGYFLEHRAPAVAQRLIGMIGGR